MKRRRKTTLTRELAKPFLGIVLLGMLWIAYEIGLVDLVARAIIAPLGPK